MKPWRKADNARRANSERRIHPNLGLSTQYSVVKNLVSMLSVRVQYSNVQTRVKCNCMLLPSLAFCLIGIAQGSRLEGLVTGRGRICDFDLKPHPESNFTEQHWELVSIHCTFADWLGATWANCRCHGCMTLPKMQQQSGKTR